jgi:hypothetical protein
VTSLKDGNFGPGPGANRPQANGTPFARPSGTPPARRDVTPGAGGFNGRGGGIGLLLRNLPQPPANLADELKLAAAANPDCQSAAFAFGGN